MLFRSHANAQPSLDDLQLFEKSVDADAETAAGVDAVPVQLCKGDRIQVTEGDVLTLQGIVMMVDGENVTVMPEHDLLTVRARVWCVCVCVCVCVCAYMCVSMCVCPCVCVYTYVYIFRVGIHAMLSCMCACVCACVTQE